MDDIDYIRYTAVDSADQKVYFKYYGDTFKIISDNEVYAPIWYEYLTRKNVLENSRLPILPTQEPIELTYRTPWLAFFQRVYTCIINGLTTHAVLNSICYMAGPEHDLDETNILVIYVLDTYEKLVRTENSF